MCVPQRYNVKPARRRAPAGSYLQALATCGSHDQSGRVRPLKHTEDAQRLDISSAHRDYSIIGEG